MSDFAVCLTVILSISQTDDICDYFGVKIAMYFAWLGFYTTSMLYPAVIGFVLWMLTESDQVSRDEPCACVGKGNNDSAQSNR